MIYLSTILSLFITIALIPIFIKLALRFQIVDIPDARKVHSSPIPRIGGIAIALGACIPIIFWQYATDFTRAYLAGAGVLVIMGLLDDWKGLDYRIKFTGQIVAALIVVLFGGIRITTLGSLLPESFLLPDWFAIPLTMIAIVGVTNAINLSDGLDGLAGGICFLSLCSIGYLAYLIDNTLVVFIAISLAGAIFGFLRFNTYPATLFMGDTGSQFLGFSLVILSLAITQGNTPLSPVLPLIIVGFPVLDTLAVMFERIAHGRSPFAADKNHFHHKLMQIGLYQTESVFVIYVLQGFLIASAILFKFYSEWFLLAGYLALSGVILAGFFVVERSGWRLKRFALIDRVIKGRLKILRERGLFIKISFRIVAVGIPLLLLITCLVPTTIPAYFSILSATLLGVLLMIWFFKRNWLRGGLTLILYLFIPFVVYSSVVSEAPWIDGNPNRLHHLLYLGLVFFVIMTLRFTRRQRGFKMTPTDFLILFIALGVPYIAGTYLKDTDLALMVARIIMLFFSYEVLIGELREKVNKLAIATGASLALVVIRGFV
jgi:UDP-GlcNAc:undecaprenyl-phosphate GlcNAc-1-phosphate transferase